MTVTERQLQDSQSMTIIGITQYISRPSQERTPIRSRVGQDSSMHGIENPSRKGSSISLSINSVNDEVRMSKNDILNSRRVLSISVSHFRRHTSSFFSKRFSLKLFAFTRVRYRLSRICLSISIPHSRKHSSSSKRRGNMYFSQERQGQENRHFSNISGSIRRKKSSSSRRLESQRSMSEVRRFTHFSDGNPM